MERKTKDEIRRISAEQNKLIREVRREELTRSEESARTAEDFQELLLAVQMMFSYMLTEDERPLRSCKHCTKAFLAEHP